MRSAFRQPLQSDIEFVGAHMREADKLTLRTLHPHQAPEQRLAIAVMLSAACWTLYEPGGNPAGIFGVVPLTMMSEVASPWMLGTDEIFKHPRALVRDGRHYTRRMLVHFPYLLNYVDARDTRAVRWLAHVGYEVHPPEPFGPGGEPFHRFELRR